MCGMVWRLCPWLQKCCWFWSPCYFHTLLTPGLDCAVASFYTYTKVQGIWRKTKSPSGKKTGANKTSKDRTLWETKEIGGVWHFVTQTPGPKWPSRKTDLAWLSRSCSRFSELFRSSPDGTPVPFRAFSDGGAQVYQFTTAADRIRGQHWKTR